MAEPFKIASSCAEAGYGEDGSCHFCGSLHPDTFMERVEKGDVTLVPTDKGYKVYIRNAGGAPFKQSYRDCPEGSAPHMPDACAHWVTREVEETKFYFDHLSVPQRQRFVELLNAKRLRLEYPGYFYRLPFFVAAKAKEA